MNKTMLVAFAAMAACPCAFGAWPYDTVDKVDIDPLETLVDSWKPQTPAPKARILLFSTCFGYNHRGGRCYGDYTVTQAGKRHGVWETVKEENPARLGDADYLSSFDAVVLNNSSGLNETNAPGITRAFVSYVENGGGVALIHAGLDAFKDSPELQTLFGGWFKGHPWHEDGSWRIKNERPDHPLNAPFAGTGPSFTKSDEIYQFLKRFDRSTCTVLLSVDLSDPVTKRAETWWNGFFGPGSTRADHDYAVSWVKSAGKGRVFYTSFGHDRAAFLDPQRLHHILHGVRYVVRGGTPDVRAERPAPATGRWKMFDRRLGMFIHWGIYSAGGWHEQERMRRGVARAEYEKTRTARFTAEKYDADAFVAAAKSLGADYIVFTSKHHDGFCLWDTATTDFNVMNTPAKRDVLKELADACRRGGLKLGLYYSNPDWHHPAAYNPKSTHQVPPEKGDRPDMPAYQAYVKAQVTELLTKYGDICCFFWDIPTKIDAPEMNALVRILQPGILINDRGWGKGGDYSTPERGVPARAAFTRFTEACDSVGAQSWGYRADEDYRTVRYLTRTIDRTLSKGGNFLLNVGPKADGTIPAESLDILRRVGDWYGKVRESYRGVETVTNLVAGATVTRRGGTVYLHYPDGVEATGLDLAPLATAPAAAKVLNDGTVPTCAVTTLPTRWRRPPAVHLSGLPADALSAEAVVIRLDLRESP